MFINQNYSKNNYLPLPFLCNCIFMFISHIKRLETIFRNYSINLHATEHFGTTDGRFQEIPSTGMPFAEHYKQNYEISDDLIRDKPCSIICKSICKSFCKKWSTSGFFNRNIKWTDVDAYFVLSLGGKSKQ